MRPYHRKLRREPMRLLVRHAAVGDGWQPAGADACRPLSPLGCAQARRLADLLGGLPILRILACPALHCQQTVAPLAQELDVRIELCLLLTPDAAPSGVLRLLRDPATENTVLCLHRKTILAVLAHATGGGRRVAGVDSMGMAAAWACYGDPDRPALLRYLGSGENVELSPPGRNRVG